MPTETIILAVAILAVGIPAIMALFGISKALVQVRESSARTEASISELSQGLIRAASDSTTRNEAILRDLSTAVVQAAQKSTQSAEAVSDSLRRLEHRVAESVASRDTQTKEDRQIAQSIASDNRQAIRQAADTLKERIDELKDRVSGVATTIKAEAGETRKWDAEKAAERMEKDFERTATALTSLIEKMETTGKQIADRIDQGSRLSAKTTDAKGDELVSQLKSVSGLQQDFRAIVSQLEQNRTTLESLRKSIVADVSTLTGE